jgi:protein-S-isoprenylcysteine O-methyltransferase Ste14
VFLRALLAFIALPGVVAFLIPLWIASGSQPAPGIAAVIALGAGLATLLWCVGSFYVSGKGTLAPWAPPRQLVTTGLYRFSRNPMYIGVLLVLAGWALLYQSSVLAWYAAAIAVAFHLRVILGEEPWLARTHGEAWSAYKRRVPRWLWSRTC